MDRALGQFGPEAGELRDELRRSVAQTIDRLWPDTGARTPVPAPISSGRSMARP